MPAHTDVFMGVCVMLNLTTINQLLQCTNVSGVHLRMEKMNDYFEQ